MKQIEKKHFGKNVGFYFHPVLISILLIAFSLLSNLQAASSLEEMKLGEYLFFLSALFVLWLTIQAKLNAFFDFHKNIIISE